MQAAARVAALRLLAAMRADDFALCRDVEAMCHAASRTEADYDAHVRRAAYNLHANPAVGREVVHASDDALAEGTLAGRIRAEARARDARFDRMLQEKYEEMDDGQHAALLRCRRCGSSEVTWEEKQTRSADEGGTVFCACGTCKHRWVLR